MTVLSDSPLIATLLRLGALGRDDWDIGLQGVLETSCELLDVARASYWSFRADPPAIVCELGAVRDTRTLERGATIEEREAPEYFAEIRCVQVLAVADARADPRLRNLAPYLATHDVGALLDVPVFAGNRLTGILCHEVVGRPRAWSGRDSELALTLGHALSTMLETRARLVAESSERRAAFLAEAASSLAQSLDPASAAELAVRGGLPVLGDICTLIAYDGRQARRIAHAHVDAGGQPLLDAFCSSFGVDIASPGIGVHALREERSLLLPLCDPDALRGLGLSTAHIDLFRQLRVRSVMAVLVRTRDTITGALTFGAVSRTYDREDLRLAEEYALQVGTQLENARLYARAQAALRARDEFLGLAGHELRTPLTALKLAVERLRRNLPPARLAVKRSADAIARQTRRLSNLTDLIVLASLHGAGDLPLRFQQVDVAAIAREVALDFAEQLAAAGCELRLHAEAPVLVRADPTGLEVALSNLLASATRFGKGAPIEVRVERSEHRATLVVRDHGGGLPVERLGDVLDHYERDCCGHNLGELGLGLHITARIVAAHRGQIHIDSRPGEGATFTVDLPT